MTLREARMPKPMRDVRGFLPLKPVQFHILLALSECDRHGYAIIQETLERTGGEVRLEMGTLYRTLHRMLGGGLVEESDHRPAPEQDDQRRRYYRLTSLGRDVAAAEANRMAALVRSAAERRLLPFSS